MSDLPRVKIGMFELRQWTYENKLWVCGLREAEMKGRDWSRSSNRFDIRYLLDMNDLEFSELIIQYEGQVFPWFGITGKRPLAAFPDYWACKKFVTEYVEPQLLMKKMTEGWE